MHNINIYVSETWKKNSVLGGVQEQTDASVTGRVYSGEQILSQASNWKKSKYCMGGRY